MSVRRWMTCAVAALATTACVGDAPVASTDAGADAAVGTDAEAGAGDSGIVPAWDQAKWDEAQWQ